MSLSTDGLPAGDRFDWWEQLMRAEVMALSMASERPERFRGRVDSVGAPDTTVSSWWLSSATGVRTRTHIRRHDPEDYYLFAVRGGRIGLEQNRGNSWLGVGDLGLYSTSRPLRAEFRGSGRPARVEMVRLPRALLPLPFAQVDRLLAARLPARTGSGALLAQHLTGFLRHAPECGPAELAGLGSVAVDLAVTLLAGRLDIARAVPPESRRQALLARIDAFIERDLHDADLRPIDIAAHHHISLRTLHELFRERPDTVSATIRRRRLERSRADLGDPRLRHKTVGEIALAWGFRHPADFSRAFRAAYGIPPGEFRQAAPSDAPEARRLR
ncbi:helix-turn-helix domain-containing protein [Streptomyces profundus]|uniref:AraC-like ligand-binding domain-containing protein n=1 Tax=Streptomyces profundus TaxID=2867410 RepID=UPI001D168D84|nr:helix-turn-helix domain-containing protein [Streptomyces sp. MA3_2.13]